MTRNYWPDWTYCPECGRVRNFFTLHPVLTGDETKASEVRYERRCLKGHVVNGEGGRMMEWQATREQKNDDGSVLTWVRKKEAEDRITQLEGELEEATEKAERLKEENNEQSRDLEDLAGKLSNAKESGK